MPVDQGSRDRNSLLQPARELVWSVLEPVVAALAVLILAEKD
jgi:hypothetical protein